MSFANLKKARKSNFSKLTEEIEKLNTTNKNNNGNSADDRFWKLTVDKAGNGHAIIRFLPAPQGEDIPWVRVWDHGFQGPGGWYIENSLTTLGKKDPVSEYNSQLWNSGVESNKDVARKQKRRLSHYANIYVVSDSANSDNEGKSFLFKFGKKIFDKVNDMMNPEFDDETPMNPFDLWEGADFKLRARQVAGFRNYDKSEFGNSKALSEDDAEMEKIWNQEYSLQEFLEPKNFKSYEELKTRMEKVFGTSQQETDFGGDNSPAPSRPVVDAHSMPTAEADAGDGDDSLSYFSKLADEA
jgi:hypothetical protein